MQKRDLEESFVNEVVAILMTIFGILAIASILLHINFASNVMRIIIGIILSATLCRLTGVFRILFPDTRRKKGGKKNEMPVM